MALIDLVESDGADLMDAPETSFIDIPKDSEVSNMGQSVLISGEGLPPSFWDRSQTGTDGLGDLGLGGF